MTPGVRPYPQHRILWLRATTGNKLLNPKKADRIKGPIGAGRLLRASLCQDIGAVAYHASRPIHTSSAAARLALK